MLVMFAAFSGVNALAVHSVPATDTPLEAEFRGTGYEGEVFHCRNAVAINYLKAGYGGARL